jgi:hypothetical protein
VTMRYNQKAGANAGFWSLGWEALLALLPRLQALRTEVDVLLDPVDQHPGALHVRIPAALCMAHGVANIVTKLRPFAATFTLGHRYTP